MIHADFYLLFLDVPFCPLGKLHTVLSLVFLRLERACLSVVAESSQYDDVMPPHSHYLFLFSDTVLQPHLGVVVFGL